MTTSWCAFVAPFHRMLACALFALLIPALAGAQASAPISALFPGQPSHVEAALVRGWLASEVADARRRQIGDRIVLPALSGALGVATLALALSSESSPLDRYGLAGASAVAFVGLGCAIFDQPHARRWAGAGVALGAAGVGLSFVLGARHLADDASDASMYRWHGAGLIAYGIGLLPALLIDPGPTADDFRAVDALPDAQRSTRTLRLLACADRAERVARHVVLTALFVSTGVMLAGAATVDDREARDWLLLSSLTFVVPVAFALLPGIFRRSRVERFLAGEAPPVGAFRW